MWIKIAGALLLMGAAGLWGIYMGSKDYFRLKDLREMQRAYAILRAEIDFGMSRLSEAAANVAQKCSGPVKEIFAAFSADIEGKDGAWQVWGEAVSKASAKAYFSGEDVEIFKSFGKTLGYLDKDMQLATIDIQQEYIDGKIRELEVLWQKSRKMYLSLGGLGGAMAVILLI